MRKLAVALALAPSLPHLAACGDRAEPQSSIVTVRDSAGIEIVEQSSIVVPRISLGEPYQVLGSIDGEEDAFYNVTGMDRLADGSWVVANNGTVEVRVFDAAGAFVRSFVGRGDGPGELSSITGMAILEEDSVFVWDLIGRRGALFTAEGELGRTLSLDARRYVTPIGFVGGDIVMTAATVSSGGDALGSRVNRSFMRGAVFDRDVELVAELDSIPGTEAWITVRESSISSRLAPFGKSGQITVAGERIVTGDSGTDELRVLDSKGRLEAIWRLLGEPGQVTEEDWSRERSRQLDEAETDSGRQAVRAMFDEMPRPERRPAWSGLTGATDGSLWIRRYEAPADAEGTSWWVVSPEGQIVREVVGPADLQLLWVGEDVAVGRRRDELDVEYLEFYRILPL